MSGEKPESQPQANVGEGFTSALRRLSQALQPFKRGEPLSVEPQQLGTLSPSASPESARPTEAETQGQLKALSHRSEAPRIQAESPGLKHRP